MPYIFRYCLLLYCLCIANPSIQGQITSEKISEWGKLLSVKTDKRWNNFFKVLQEIRALDESKKCPAVDQLAIEGPVRNKYFRIRSSYLRAYVLTDNKLCAEIDSRLQQARLALDQAYEMDDLYLIELGNKTLSSIYNIRHEFGLAMMHLRAATEIQDQAGRENFHEVPHDHAFLAELSYHTRDYEQCIRFSKKALQYDLEPKSTGQYALGDTARLFLFNTLGLAYEKLSITDSAFLAFDEALRVWQRIRSPNWDYLIKGNRGDVFFDLGQYDSARVLLQQDVEHSLASGPLWADNAANSMQKLARIHAFEGQPQTAIEELRKAEKILGTLPNAQYKRNIYAAYMLAYQKLGNADSLYVYTQKYQVLHDSLERAASDARTEIVQVRLDNQENISKIRTLNKEKARITLIRNFIILLTVFATIIGYLYINRQRLKMRIRHQQAVEAKRKAEAEANEAKNQLNAFTQNMLEKTSLVEKLQGELMEKELTDLQIQYIQELSQHSILTDADWDNFKNLFDKVYPAFLLHLKNKAPDITLAELRTAALIKLQVTTKEAAHLLGISPNSVNKTKQRLRSRLGMDAEGDLESFFATL